MVKCPFHCRVKQDAQCFLYRYFVVCAFVSDNKIIPAIFTLPTLIFSYKTVPCYFFTTAFLTFEHNTLQKKYCLTALIYIMPKTITYPLVKPLKYFFMKPLFADNIRRSGNMFTIRIAPDETKNTATEMYYSMHSYIIYFFANKKYKNTLQKADKDPFNVRFLLCFYLWSARCL